MYIRAKGRGKWQCVWEVRDAAGTRRRMTEIVRGTKKDAEARWVTRQAELTAEAARPQPVHPRDWTVGDLLAYWVAEVAPGTTIRDRTRHDYQQLITHHILPTLGAHRLTDLHATHIQAAERQWLTAGRLDGRGGLAPSTVRQLHAILQGALAQAVAWDLIPANPAQFVKRPHLPPQTLQIWTPADIERFWAVAQHHRFGGLFGFVLRTGLRQSEALGLPWTDCDLDAGVIHVRQQLLPRPDSAGRRFGDVKTARGRRRVELDPDTVRLVRHQRTAQKADRLAWGPAYRDHGLVWQTQVGTPFLHRNVARLFQTLQRQAGVPIIPFHALRHTHASLLIAHGADPKLVSERLGHASVAFTLQIYGHLWPGRQREVLAHLPRLFPDER
jgi:integrase